MANKTIALLGAIVALASVGAVVLSTNTAEAVFWAVAALCALVWGVILFGDMRRKRFILSLARLRATGVSLRNNNTATPIADVPDFVASVNRWEADVIRCLAKIDKLDSEGFGTLNTTSTALTNPTNADHELHWRCHDERIRRLEGLIEKHRKEKN